jgi:Arc/MetJ-type ribon-helix-helix transcriptional regulator
MKVYRLSARIDEELHRKLAARARLEATDESEVVREALRRYLNERIDNAYEALMRAGGIGIAKGLPSDLSVNKNYFEGFGRNDRARSSGHRSSRRPCRQR